jgi:hypothetical protein
MIKVATDASDIADAAALSGWVEDGVTDELYQHRSTHNVNDLLKVFARSPAGGIGAGVHLGDVQEEPTTEVRLAQEPGTGARHGRARDRNAHGGSGQASPSPWPKEAAIYSFI